MPEGSDIVVVDGEILIVDLDSIVLAALELKEEEQARTAFVRAVADGTPASKAYMSIWQKYR